MIVSPSAPVVVGVDGSSQSVEAVDWAARDAQVRQRPLRIVHAFLWPLLNVPLGPSDIGPPEGGLQHAAERILSIAVARAREIAPDLDISTDLPVCSPAAALIEESRTAALVVVGNRGLGGFMGLLVGSVGVQAAAHAACPVVVVRAASADGDDAGPAAGQVVVGVDGSDLSNDALDFAFAHAARSGMGVRAVHVYQWPVAGDPGLAGYYSPADLRDDQARLLAGALAGLCNKHPEVPVEHRVLHGHPATVVLAESAGAALTVVGSRGRGGFAGLLLGSTSQSVLHHASGPVAIVRARTP